MAEKRWRGLVWPFLVHEQHGARRAEQPRLTRTGTRERRRRKRGAKGCRHARIWLVFFSHRQSLLRSLPPSHNGLLRQPLQLLFALVRRAALPVDDGSSSSTRPRTTHPPELGNRWCSGVGGSSRAKKGKRTAVHKTSRPGTPSQVTAVRSQAAANAKTTTTGERIMAKRYHLARSFGRAPCSRTTARRAHPTPTAANDGDGVGRRELELRLDTAPFRRAVNAGMAAAAGATSATWSRTSRSFGLQGTWDGPDEERSQDIYIDQRGPKLSSATATVDERRIRAKALSLLRMIPGAFPLLPTTTTSPSS
uniref:Uncharacterized protein n=1 Tax=Mycena chlorophos TaxID=658473 RepID=A0ABQ0LDN6_MYCCL|nr:predicted protein [Mycena chlorophos]